MPRLCLSRKTAETIYIDTPAGRIVIAIDQARRGRVKLCIEAPEEFVIRRGEILPRQTQPRNLPLSDGQTDSS